MDGWTDFMVVEAGAAAVLAGLIFVGLSINLERLLKIPAVLLRAGSALVMLLGVLVVSSLTLVPDQSVRAIGVEILVAGSAVWVATTILSVRNVRATDEPYRRGAIVLLALRQLSTIPLVVSGILLMTGREDGIYWTVPAFILTFVVVIMESWVILVEIDR